MAVLSVRLDLTLSAHFIGPFVSTTVDMPYPNVLTYLHAEHFQSTCARNIFQHEIITLYYWEFAVFGDALCSLVWFHLCFALTHEVHHG